MKKKMTVSEFEEWSRFTSEIRDKAVAEEIPFVDCAITNETKEIIDR